MRELNNTEVMNISGGNFATDHPYVTSFLRDLGPWAAEGALITMAFQHITTARGFDFTSSTYQKAVGKAGVAGVAFGAAGAGLKKAYDWAIHQLLD